MALAAGDDAAALGLGVVDELLDLLHRLLVDQRALLGAVLQARADLELDASGGELLDELLIDAGLHEEAVGADAGLAGVAVFGDDRAFDRAVDIGVVEDEERRVAAELHRHLLHRRGAFLDQQLADLGRAGEGQLLHQRVGADLVADLAGRAGHDVDHALREAGLLGQHAPGERRIGRLRGRLHDRRAARRQRRAELAGQHGGREIPRRDRRDHADRLLGGDDAAVGPGRRHHVAIGAAALFGEPQHIGRRDRDLALGLGERLALLGGQEFGERLLVVHDRVMQLAQQLVAVEHRGLLPRLEGRFGRLDGAARLGFAGLRHRADLEAGRRIGHIDRRAAVGLHPFAADQVRLAHEMAGFLEHRLASSTASLRRFRDCRGRRGIERLSPGVALPQPVSGDQSLLADTAWSSRSRL